jgi:tetratricopeptide (TPR) repeat protein
VSRALLSLVLLAGVLLAANASASDSDPPAEAASGPPMGARSWQKTGSAEELLREAREHEARKDDFVAIRRYMEAIALDPTLGSAYLGLGALRLRRGDPREAERVYEVALSRLPALGLALIGRAEARWALGDHAAAEADLEAYARTADDPGALRELAGWYAQESRAPAQLAVWRRIHFLASARNDPALEHEARTMVRALQILVGAADPATRPMVADPVRRGIARVAARGG